MELYNLKDFKAGWILGNFDPCILKTNNFEVAIKHYVIGQNDACHYHKLADEITVVVSGLAKMNGLTYKTNDVILVKKGESTDFIPLADTTTCVIKIPSVTGDKYLCE